jgi:glycine/D-amino acid oxidase-like deaminating enzyme
MLTSSESHRATEEGLWQRRWGKPPWRPETVPAVPLDLSRTEVAIVGGGFTGVSAAYHLARSGLRARVFEAGVFGDGASGRSGGIALQGTARGILPGTEHCVEKLKEVIDAEQIDCDPQLAGCWEIEHVQERGTSVLPWHDDGLAIRVKRSVDGGTVDPMALLAGLARAAARAGATFHEWAPVRKILCGAKPAVELDAGSVQAEYVVAALNAWTSPLLPEVRSVSSALTTACATQPLSAPTLAALGLGPGSCPFYTVDLPYLWGRMLGKSQVIFGAGLVFGAPSALEKVDIADEEPRRAMERLKGRVRGLHPALERVEFAAQWAGPVAIAEDFAPLLGRLPAAPSVIVAGGYSGHGVALSVWMGAAIAKAIAQGTELPAWGALTNEHRRA